MGWIWFFTVVFTLSAGIWLLIPTLRRLDCAHKKAYFIESNERYESYYEATDDAVCPRCGKVWLAGTKARLHALDARLRAERHLKRAERKRAAMIRDHKHDEPTPLSDPSQEASDAVERKIKAELEALEKQ